MSPAQPTKGIDFNSAMMADLTVHQNVRQELVVTTVDKLKICLMENREQLTAGREWMGMVGLTLSLVATLIAATFKDKWLPAATWEALYLLCSIAAAAYSSVLIIRAVRSAISGGIDELIDRIAKRSKPVDSLLLSDTMLRALYSEAFIAGAEKVKPSSKNPG